MYSIKQICYVQILWNQSPMVKDGHNNINDNANNNNNLIQAFNQALGF